MTASKEPEQSAVDEPIVDTVLPDTGRQHVETARPDASHHPAGTARPGIWHHRATTTPPPRKMAGQATAEYALVLLGAAAVALMLAAWAAKSGAIGDLFDAIVGQLLDKAQ